MSVTEDLIRESLIVEVSADPTSARKRLAEAARHLEAAEMIVGVDPSGAYQLAYDGARKAIVAAMVASGLRITAKHGAHAIAGRYATGLADAKSFAAFDRMRRNRNRSEYGSRSFSRTEVLTDLANAQGMVAAVDRLLHA